MTTTPSELLFAALAGVPQHDKFLTSNLLEEASKSLGEGQRPIRHYIRAAQCVTDIGRWDLCWDHIVTALYLSTGAEPGTLTLPDRHPSFVG